MRGRNLKDQARQHLDSSYVFKTDISDFYPSVSYQRVYRLFVEDFECTPDVARACTKICTYRYHLALGLITSPILADQALKKVDARIGAACRELDLTYTRWVDDIAISGKYDLRDCGIRQLIPGILRQHGFRTNPAKDECGRLSDGLSITKIRLRNGHLDVQGAYYDELERQLNDAKHLEADAPFAGPYYTPEQIRGRVEFVSWVNPRRRNILKKRYRSINWRRVEEVASRRGLCALARRLVREHD